MRKYRFTIVLLLILAMSWLLFQMESQIRTMSAQINAMQSEITAIRKHDVSQDKWIGDVAAMRQKPAQVAEKSEAVEVPDALPAIVPIPFYLGAFETLKQLIFR